MEELQTTLDKMHKKSRQEVNFNAIEDNNKKAKRERLRGQKQRKVQACGRLPGYNRLMLRKRGKRTGSAL